VAPNVLLTLVLVFVAVALLVGGVAQVLMARTEAGRRRLSELVQAPPAVVVAAKNAQLMEDLDGWSKIANALPTSRGSVERLRRELLLTGMYSSAAPALFSIAEIVLPVALGAIPILWLDGPNKILTAFLGAFMGYMAPGFYLRQRLKKAQKDIQNGLADALDLLVLCLEAGSSLDQAIVKASDELGVAYPALGDQLRILISEMRAGKTRMDAFRGLADRTRVEDVRTLVSMLVQTDRFGTSIAQALRTQSEVCRTKRRQRAEEKAQKVGVKLVFPLVFCLFPALYVVMLGPAYIKFMKVFAQ
jgi:tight adherence protein C